MEEETKWERAPLLLGGKVSKHGPFECNGAESLRTDWKNSVTKIHSTGHSFLPRILKCKINHLGISIL
jgi:hypothetical protein